MLEKTLLIKSQVAFNSLDPNIIFEFLGSFVLTLRASWGGPIGPPLGRKFLIIFDRVNIFSRNLDSVTKSWIARVSYGMSKKLKNLKCLIPSCSSPSDRVIYISKDAYLNVEYDFNCFQLEFVTLKKDIS